MMSYEEIINRNEKPRIILFEDKQKEINSKFEEITNLSGNDQTPIDNKEDKRGLEKEWQQEYLVIYQSYVLEN